MGIRAFRWVWGGETVSMVGDASYTVVFAWLVLSVTGSPAALGAVMLAVTIPSGVLVLVGGAITDRFSARAVMLVTHLVRGAAMAVLAVLASAGAVHVWHLVLVGVVVGSADAFFGPASGSILPSLVPAAGLPRANALLGASEQVSFLVGPVLGGVLVAVAGTPFAIGFNAVTFFVAALSLFAAPRAVPEPAEPFSVRAVLREIGAGLAYARRNAEVRIVLLLVAAATLSYSGLFSVGLPALSRTFGNGAVVLGAMVSAWGLGQLVGTLAAAATGLPRRWGLLIIGMTVVEGAAFAVLGFVPHYLLAVVLLALLGIGVAYATDVALPAFVQTRTPAAMLGRVNSLIGLPRAALAPVSVAGLGLLAALDVRWAFLAAAVPMLLAGIVLAVSGKAKALTLR
ncbi:MFS transporter [Labedaea rhizosphaerae]|uniref:Putative MFS family arabinose efflux permease n=1 Tax=Labedaea rhizosphaerae TaxID=598644 RepID=A0A4R6RSY8_LABRH|nr:MFS transporter [Labedaea rhizosphaerae]TDP89993.1 putative MFS family arabinose efflux permease [Labedaea rhizosphaerae]